VLGPGRLSKVGSNAHKEGYYRLLYSLLYGCIIPNHFLIIAIDVLSIGGFNFGADPSRNTCFASVVALGSEP